jgi:hypothetical protein
MYDGQKTRRPNRGNIVQWKENLSRLAGMQTKIAEAILYSVVWAGGGSAETQIVSKEENDNGRHDSATFRSVANFLVGAFSLAGI